MRYNTVSEENRINSMLWDTVKCYAACAVGGFLAGAVAITMLLIYCRMAGPLM